VPQYASNWATKYPFSQTVKKAEQKKKAEEARKEEARLHEAIDDSE
jgi:translation initiation factor IF-3